MEANVRQSNLKMTLKCTVCSLPGDKSCSACRSVHYCSSEHQKSHWNIHKKECSPYAVMENERFGRYLVAARKLKAGTLIIEEDPVFCAPRGLVDTYDNPICLSCCKIMEGGIEKCRCSKCNWPVCSQACESHRYHAENECEIFAQGKVVFPPLIRTVYECYKIIEVIRCLLLKRRKPKVWTKLLNLQYKTDLGVTTSFIDDVPTLQKDFGVQDLGSDDDWNRAHGLININNFAMEGARGGSTTPSFTGLLFLKSSMLAHSCAPNCWWGVTVYPDFKMNVRTSNEIQKGEMITVPYSYAFNAFGTHKRQELLKGDAEFICKCTRCLDPKELGSYASGIVCLNCKAGYILPTNPIDCDSEWKCEECNHTFAASVVMCHIDLLMDMLEGSDTVPAMEDFISSNRGVVLHPNHWLLTEADDVIVKQRAANTWATEYLSEKERDQYISHCEHLLRVKDILAPGISLERGNMQNHLARALLEKLDHQFKSKTITDEAEIKRKMIQIYNLYDQALLFYKNDPTQTPLKEKYGLKARTIISDMEYVRKRFIPGVDFSHSSN